MKKLSLTQENPLTLRCKFFGCLDQVLPAIYHDVKEKHGIKIGKFTAATSVVKITWRGCIRCNNFHEIISDEEITWPYWECYCDQCRNGDW